MMPVFPLLSGSLGGGVMALVLKALWDHLSRPRLRAELFQRGGYRSVPTSTGREDKYLRLRVSNVGYSSIKNCQAFITRVTKSAGNNPVFDYETSPLNWSNNLKMGIPRGVSLYLDVCSLRSEPKPSRLIPAVPAAANHFGTFFEDRARYKIFVVVAAENAQPLSRTVTVDFDPERDDLTVHWDRWWRRLVG
jgi:hypothetical protein